RAISDGANELPSWRPVRRRLLDGVRFLIVLMVWTAPNIALAVAAPPSLHRPLPPLPGYAHDSLGFTALNAFGAFALIWTLALALLYPGIWAQYVSGG